MFGQETTGFYLISFKTFFGSYFDFDASSNLWYWVYGGLDFNSKGLYLGYSSDGFPFIWVYVISGEIPKALPNTDKSLLPYDVIVGIWNETQQICNCQMQNVKFFFTECFYTQNDIANLMLKDPGIELFFFLIN